MSPTPRPPHPLRRCARSRGGAPSRAWLRILVLLLVAILATGAHPEALAASAATPTATAESGTAEHDVLDTALRPPTRQGHRPLTTLRPDAEHPEREPRPRPVTAPAPPSYSPTLHSLRCVVLRC
ncbi:hypothetical protein [Streptomyces sp. NPDC001530]|uniref:hypothetical protein n=1 Tax=Streptomyces sp. NPDC001530 TaxID=3364582 RepID=UPI0036A28841